MTHSKRIAHRAVQLPIPLVTVNDSSSKATPEDPVSQHYRKLGFENNDFTNAGTPYCQTPKRKGCFLLGRLVHSYETVFVKTVSWANASPTNCPNVTQRPWLMPGQWTG